MAKFKLAKSKTVVQPQMKSGLPCVIFVILVVIFIMALIYLVMRHAG